jgi:hypothetical protein
MSQVARYGLKYAIELISNIRDFADSLGRISSNQQIPRYLAAKRFYASSAMGLSGLMFYDMAVGDKKVPRERKLVGRTASGVVLLTVVVDGIVDRGTMSLEEKFKFLDGVKSDLFGYSSNTSENFGEEASYVLARAVYSDLLSRDRDRKVEKIFDELVEVIKRQFSEKNHEELLRIAKTTGACCAESTAVLTEIVRGEEYPKIRESARRMGEYCELLDHWYELDDDLAEGANTYPTVRIRQERDCPALRREIRRELLVHADESVLAGFNCLSTLEQRGIYRTLKTMIDFKYKVAGRLH